MTTTARAEMWRDAGTRGGSRRFAGSIVASAVLHVLVIVGGIAWGATHRPAATPPVYKVDLVAAPPGPRSIGTVAPEPPPPSTPAPTPPAPTPEPVAPPRPETRPREMPAPQSSKTKPAPPIATPVPATPNKATPAKTPPKTPPKAAELAKLPSPNKLPPLKRTPDGPRAGGGPEGGRGADVANVHVAGLDFPYEGYLANIVRQVALRFTPPSRNASLQADIAFLIHRDGSVTDVRMVKGSGNYGFDLEARGAIEETGRARAFGPLPTGFNADVLPVTFSFDPRVIR